MGNNKNNSSMASFNAKSHDSLPAEPHARLSDKIIYTNSNMSRENLSKLSKDQLIMLLGKQTVSAKKTGPVKQTVSTAVGPVFQHKSLTQLGANKVEQSIKPPALLPK